MVRIQTNSHKSDSKARNDALQWKISTAQSVQCYQNKTGRRLDCWVQSASVVLKGSSHLQKSKARDQTGNIHSVNKVKVSQNQCNYHWNELPRKRVDSQGWMSFWKYCFSQTRVIWLHRGVAGWNLRTCDIQEIRLDDLMVPADHKLSESMQTCQRVLNWDIKFTFDTKLFTNWLWCRRLFRIQAQLFKAASG